jgi:hypothetical protein
VSTPEHYQRNKKEVRRKQAEYYQQNKEAAKRRNDRRPPASKMLSSAKQRARRKDLPFDLELEDIVVPTHCPVLGMELRSGTCQDRDASPSLDRIDPALGYVKGNVHVISQKANRIKNDATLAELQAVTKYLEEITCGIINDS